MRILRAILASLGSPICWLAAVPILVLGFPFWGIAGLTRLVSWILRFGAPHPVPWQQLMAFEPTIGWKPRPLLDAYAKGARVFHLTTDAEGWRGRTTIEESDIIVFGDSFAFGYGADDRTWFAALHTTLRIKGIGANGYNMVQELLWMERLAPRLRGKLVVWFVYYGNDLYENLQPNLDRYRMPFVRPIPGSKDWEIVTSHIRPEPWPCPTPRRYYPRLAEICRPSFLSERAFAACSFLLARGRDICREARAPLVVIGIPVLAQLEPEGISRLAAMSPDAAAFDPDLPDRRLAETCRALGVPFVPLKDHLTAADYIRGDGHWTPAGHRRVATLLGQLHRELIGAGKPDRTPRLEIATS